MKVAKFQGVPVRRYSAIATSDGVVIMSREWKWADPFVPEVDTEHDAQWWRDYEEAMRELEE